MVSMQKRLGVELIMKKSRKRQGKIGKKQLILLVLPLIVILLVAAIVVSALLLQPSEGEAPGNTESTPTTTGPETITTTPITAAGKWVVEGEQAFYLDGSGNPFTGTHTIDGAEYTFAQDGSLLNGWVTVGNIRYHFADGALSKGTQVIDGVTRYINADGTMFVGWYDNDKTGNRYYYDFDTGASYRGWKEIEGKNYYFHPDGTLARSTTVDGVAIDAEGVAAGRPSGTTSTSSSTSPATRPPAKPDATVPAELGSKLDSILATYGDSPQNIYDYVHGNFSYKYAPEGSIAENAQHMLDYGTGSCYNFASLTYLLFQRAGYDVYYVTGKGWQPGDYHCWILAYFDGGWYYVDSLYTRSAKLTAEQLETKGYEWDKSAYPS